jgi:hypothetical protein
MSHIIRLSRGVSTDAWGQRLPPLDIKNRKTYLVNDMTDLTSFTLADLTRLTGAKRRSVQLWAEAGVIRADKTTERAGTGTHRRFSRDEAIVACLVHPFAMRQISIGELLNVSTAIRRHLNETPVSRDIIERVISREREAYLLMTTTGPDFWGATFFEPDPKSPNVYEAIGVHMTNLLHHKEHGRAGAIAMAILLNTYLKPLT